MNEPRILTLTGTAHPQALVQHIDPANGILMFAWLDASGNRVDSGNSGAKFAPVAPLPKDNPTDPDTYPEVEDSVLIDAIENPPVEAPPVPAEVIRRQLLLALYGAGITREQIRGMLEGNEAALIEYDEALTFRRDHALIASLANAVGLSSAQVDDLFRSAAAL